MSKLAILPYSPSAVAEVIYTVLEEAARTRGKASLAIPGGRSPGAVLEALAQRCHDFLRERLHLFWVDERGVEVGHADRNDTPTLAAWQQGGELPANVYPMPAEKGAVACAEYTAALKAACGEEITIDVSLLGIGEDGHIASLFPNHEGLDEMDPVWYIEDSPKPPPQRMSVSLDVIARSRKRIVLSLGEAKGAVAAAIQKDGRQRLYPVSLLPEENTIWYLDDAAQVAVNNA